MAEDALASRLVSIFDHFIAKASGYRCAFSPALFMIAARSSDNGCPLATPMPLNRSTKTSPAARRPTAVVTAPAITFSMPTDFPKMDSLSTPLDRHRIGGRDAEVDQKEAAAGAVSNDLSSNKATSKGPRAS